MTEVPPPPPSVVCTRNLPRFVLFMAKSRWFSVFASLMVMAGSGTIYLFGTYSKELKTTFGYDQETLNWMGFFKDLGANIGIFAGLIAEVMQTWFVLLIGAAMNFFGYFMMWLGVTGRIVKPEIWQIRGIMIGLLKGYIGLSGAIITQIYLVSYGFQDRQALILLIGCLPAAFSVVFLCTIRPIKITATAENLQLKVFFRLLYVSIVLALFLMAMTLTQKSVVFPRAALAATATVRGVSELDINETRTSSNNLRGTIRTRATRTRVGSRDETENNLGHINEALGYKPQTINTFVSLISIWNFLCRIFSGYVSEILFMRYKIPRPLIFTIVLTLECLAYLLVALTLECLAYLLVALQLWTVGESSWDLFTQCVEFWFQYLLYIHYED
ncbi:hypothetical protein ACFX1T_009487 [Malus domestica]